MIRNIVLVKLKAGLDPAVAAKAQQAFLDLNCPGTLSYVIGDDLGLREGNWSFAIVADFTDADAPEGGPARSVGRSRRPRPYRRLACGQPQKVATIVPVPSCPGAGP
jgi:hypothetical protein